MIKAVADGRRSVRRGSIGGTGDSGGSGDSSGGSHNRGDYGSRSGATETLLRRRREIVLILRSDRLFA